MHAFMLQTIFFLLDSIFNLTDKGILVAKMKIVLSGISRSGDSDNVEEFMKKVDDDVNRMSSLPSSNLSTIGQVLKSTKAIMDRFSKVVHLSWLNRIIVIRLIEVITRYTRYSMYHGLLFPAFTR